MKGILRRPPLLLLVVGVLAILLPLLAYLQYDWLGKVSEREREQMQAGLRRTLGQFRTDFDREIARVFLQFQAGPAMSRAPGEYAKLYAHWNATAPYPKLIKDIFLGEFDISGVQKLQRLNLSSGAWEPADWTAEFGPRRPVDPIDGSIPAVVIPVFSFTSFPAEAHFMVRRDFDENIQHVIVRLDLKYIQSEFIPALVRSHFAGNVSEYRIQITGGEDNSRMIYSSDDGPAATEGDASEGLMSLRLAEFRNLLPATLPVAGEFVSATRVNTFDVRVFRGVAAEKVTEIDSGMWRATAIHQSGSLDAAVAEARHRNMAISFSILGLLGVSVALILVSTGRAQRLARQQMEFVSTVSHELRTPLAVICSAGENLADGVVRDSEQLKSYGKVVRNEGRRLAEMVEQVLSFAGIQSGLKKHALVQTDAALVVDRALEALAMSIREGGFEVERRVSEDSPMVMADAASLSRAIQNLISNAMKYGGSSRWIGVWVSRSGNSVRIAVQDRGAGISSSDLPHIFEPFYRGRFAVEGQIQGSGLGLSLVREIVNVHGGQVDVASNPGGGTTFCIILPVAS